MKKTIISLALASLMFGETTMCYIEGIQRPSQLQNSKLNGGKCAGLSNINDMKSQGWHIKDIAMIKNKQNNTINYSYIFENSLSSSNKMDLGTQTNDIDSGKKLYERKCQSCHGKDGTKEPNNSAKLTTLTSEKFKDEMRAYSINELDKGSAIIMNPYATGSTNTDKIANYLQSIGILK